MNRDDVCELWWGSIRKRAFTQAKIKSNDHAAMAHACGLMIGFQSEINSIYRGMEVRRKYLSLYRSWIDEMDDRYEG